MQPLLPQCTGAWFPGWEPEPQVVSYCVPSLPFQRPWHSHLGQGNSDSAPQDSCEGPKEKLSRTQEYGAACGEAAVIDHFLTFLQEQSHSRAFASLTCSLTLSDSQPNGVRKPASHSQVLVKRFYFHCQRPWFFCSCCIFFLIFFWVFLFRNECWMFSKVFFSELLMY